MNCSSSTRRSQAALFAEMPAQGKRRGIRDRDIDRFADFEISDLAEREPLVRRFAKKRARRRSRPAASREPRRKSRRDAIESFSKKRRRGISSAEGGSAPHFDSLGAISFTANFANPSGERGNKKTGPDRENDP